MHNCETRIEENLRFCSVNGEHGYFHTWEHYSKPLPASPLVGGAQAYRECKDLGGEPAGVFSQTFGIVEFHNGVRRVDPTLIKFLDEIPKELEAIKKYIEEETE